jgi:hypothetical protein
MQNQFERLSVQDRDRRDTSAYALQGRAGELQAALRPIGDIRPVLSSRYLVKG